VIKFERQSAVNYEARQRALEMLREHLRKHPDSRFRIEGAANDSRYATANREIAGNRVRFLLSFLSVNGIDKSRFSVERTRESEEAGEDGRLVIITEISGES